jgi:hypothetical protein
MDLVISIAHRPPRRLRRHHCPRLAVLLMRLDVVTDRLAMRGDGSFPDDVVVHERPAWGVALYYAVLAFNLIVTAWIAFALRGLSRSREPRNDLATGEIKTA